MQHCRQCFGCFCLRFFFHVVTLCFFSSSARRALPHVPPSCPLLLQCLSHLCLVRAAPPLSFSLPHYCSVCTLFLALRRPVPAGGALVAARTLPVTGPPSLFPSPPYVTTPSHPREDALLLTFSPPSPPSLTPAILWTRLLLSVVPAVPLPTPFSPPRVELGAGPHGTFLNARGFRETPAPFMIHHTLSSCHRDTRSTLRLSALCSYLSNCLPLHLRRLHVCVLLPPPAPLSFSPHRISSSEFFHCTSNAERSRRECVELTCAAKGQGRV